jgi:hypothetical protein
MSGDYQLEVIISDDRLDSQTRKTIAPCKINFRYSLEHPLPHELKYQEPSIIMTEAPATRVDPPALFTGFVVLLICLLFGLFLWGLNHQKLNLSLFPADGVGLLLNVLFIGSLGLVIFMLFKFWSCWNFIQTIQYLIVTSTYRISSPPHLARRQLRLRPYPQKLICLNNFRTQPHLSSHLSSPIHCVSIQPTP